VFDSNSSYDFALLSSVFFFFAGVPPSSRHGVVPMFYASRGNDCQILSQPLVSSHSFPSPGVFCLSLKKYFARPPAPLPKCVLSPRTGAFWKILVFPLLPCSDRSSRVLRFWFRLLPSSSRNGPSTFPVCRLKPYFFFFYKFAYHKRRFSLWR